MSTRVRVRRDQIDVGRCDRRTDADIYNEKSRFSFTITLDTLYMISDTLFNS